jgi:hypothetical protein
MEESCFMEEVDMSKFVKDIIIHYKNGSNQQIIDPYQLNQVLSVLSSATLKEEREVISLLNNDDMQASKSTTGGNTNAVTGTEFKAQVIEVLRDVFSSDLYDTTKTNNKVALACEQTNSQENINHSFEGETWDGVDMKF